MYFEIWLCVGVFVTVVIFFWLLLFLKCGWQVGGGGGGRVGKIKVSNRFPASTICIFSFLNKTFVSVFMHE